MTLLLLRPPLQPKYRTARRKPKQNPRLCRSTSSASRRLPRIFGRSSTLPGLLTWRSRSLRSGTNSTSQFGSLERKSSEKRSPAGKATFQPSLRPIRPWKRPARASRRWKTVCFTETTAIRSSCASRPWTATAARSFPKVALVSPIISLPRKQLRRRPESCLARRPRSCQKRRLPS